MNNAIRIPLTLELGQMNNQLEEMRKKLREIKPDTVAYKQLEKTLKKAEQDMARVSASSQKSFTNTTDVEKYSRQFEDLVSNVKSFWSTLLDIDGSQLNLIDTDEIIRAKEELHILAENLRFIESKKIGVIKDGKLGTRFDESENVQKAAEEIGVELTPEVKLDTLRTKISIELKEIEKQFNAAIEEATSIDDAKKAMVGSERATKNTISSALSKVEGEISSEDIENILINNLGLTDVAVRDAIDKIGDGKDIPIQDLIDKIYTNALAALDRHATSQSEITANLASKKNILSTAQLEVGQASVNIGGEKGSFQREVDILKVQLKELYAELAREKGILEDIEQNFQEAGAAGQSGTQKMAQGMQQVGEASERAKKLANMKDAIKSWMGFSSVINIARDALRNAYQHIVELDKVMTEIAVVTDMTQAQLWDQISTYSEIAQQYGATTEGVYQVSQLYYQQGLQTADVMKLTEETLKMAKIAGIEYKDATDYMTVAIRGFKMEMTDAQRVVDVYSHIAAITASDTEELAVAMSKTASSAEAVGSSFENTTAMIALMVETTREAPENIGSALKSIISRYGEMTSDPTKLVDSEGEEMNLNKVDKALKSVGITLQDANGQFRNFDEVILELSSKWDTIDTNTQRYIATVMARQHWSYKTSLIAGTLVNILLLSEYVARSNVQGIVIR